MTSLEARVEEEVAGVGDLSRDELAARWVKAYGCPPPKGVKRGLLERAAAWHLQARHFGGLSPTARKAVRDAVRTKPAGRVSAVEDHKHSNAERRVARLNSPVKSAPVLRPGARLVREWNGRTYIVDVSDTGFIFDGKTFGSLSAIAKRITGTQWSGPRFFGL